MMPPRGYNALVITLVVFGLFCLGFAIYTLVKLLEVSR